MDTMPPLAKRGKALEEMFFAKQEATDIDRYRQKMSDEKEMDAIAKASGFDDQDLLQHLVELGVKAQTLAAISLIPVIEVAWSDGTLDSKERSAILETMKQEGIHEATASYELLQSWLDHQPDSDIVEAWNVYIDGLADALEKGAFMRFGQKIIDMARRVAEASGGILGLGNKISASEETVLARLRAKFN